MELELLQTLQQLHHPILDRVMIFVTTLGNAGWFFILLGVVLLCMKRTRKAGIHVLVSLVFSLIICNFLLKEFVARERPFSHLSVQEIKLLIAAPKDFSFPSGHTSAAVAAAASVYVYSKKYGIALFVLAIAIAFSRMYLFVHFPTDILGGMITGIASALLAGWLLGKLEKRKHAL